MNFKSFKKVVAIIISVIIVAACIPTISFGANAAATPKGVNISVTKTQVIIKINGIGKSGKASVYRYVVFVIHQRQIHRTKFIFICVLLFGRPMVAPTIGGSIMLITGDNVHFQGRWFSWEGTETLPYNLLNHINYNLS